MKVPQDSRSKSGWNIRPKRVFSVLRVLCLCISAELMQVSDFQARGQDDLVRMFVSEGTGSMSTQHSTAILLGFLDIFLTLSISQMNMCIFN